MGRKLTGDDRTLDDALRLCRNAATVADMRMALSMLLPGRLDNLGVSLSADFRSRLSNENCTAIF